MSSDSCALISFNGGEPLEVHEMEYRAEPITYWSATAVRPDSSWRYTDEQGHKHRWKQDEDKTWRVTKSTTRTEHVPCDGSCGNWDCEGYDITVYECSKCGERLKPGWLPDNGLKQMPGLTTTTAVVHAREADLPAFGSRSPFALTMNKQVTMRGMATVTDFQGRNGHGEARIHLVPDREHTAV